MSKKAEQTSLITLIARASAIALIAVAMPFGLDISIDGDVSFGAPVAYAKRGGVGESGSDRGNNGHGNGGETGQGEEGDTDADPSNPGRGGKSGGDAGDGPGGGEDGGGNAEGGGGSDGEGENDSGADSDEGEATGSDPSAPGLSIAGESIGLNGSVESAGPDLTEQEEQDLISRGWQ